MYLGIVETVVVPQNHCAVVEVFGKPSKTLKSGLNIIFPMFGLWHRLKDVSVSWTDRTNKEGIYIELSEQLTNTTARACATKDNVEVGVDCILRWRVTDPLKAIYAVDNLHASMAEKVLAEVRGQVGLRSLDQLLSARAKMSDEIITSISGTLSKWGVTVIGVEIQQLNLDENVKTAMLQQMEAERRARAIALEAEGTRKAIETKAEAEKNAAITSAEGQRVALSITAQAQKEYLSELSSIVGVEAATKILLNMQTLTGYDTISKNEADKVYLPSNLPAMINIKD